MENGNINYLHGYQQLEAERLSHQAEALSNLLHHDSYYLPGERILEAGCGVGAQTIHLAKNSPGANFLSIDQSQQSIRQAEKTIQERGLQNVSFQQADIYQLPFEENSFDHLFLCFVLEHLKDPIMALEQLKRVIKPGGSITLIEGDHGSFYCFPETKYSIKVVNCLIDIQATMGGNGLIGRQLYPLLNQAGYYSIQVAPRMVYVDDSKPQLIDAFSKNTFIAMVEGVKEQAVKEQLISLADWQQGISDLYQATKPGASFCYTFFKGHALKGRF